MKDEEYKQMRDEFISIFEYYKEIVPLNKIDINYNFDYDTIMECYNDAISYCNLWHLLDE